MSLVMTCFDCRCVPNSTVHVKTVMWGKSTFRYSLTGIDPELGRCPEKQSYLQCQI